MVFGYLNAFIMPVYYIIAAYRSLRAALSGGPGARSYFRINTGRYMQRFGSISHTLASRRMTEFQVPPEAAAFRIIGNVSRRAIYSRLTGDPVFGAVLASAAPSKESYWTLIKGTGSKDGLFLFENLVTGKVFPRAHQRSRCLFVVQPRSNARQLVQVGFRHRGERGHVREKSFIALFHRGIEWDESELFKKKNTGLTVGLTNGGRTLGMDVHKIIREFTQTDSALS
ncbi:hypothetical protein B0H16DRAFT_1473629 [Mycena metata]|uniref:Uncharacterized protein n=1 Tax=Mycena metata TaxID=1033252 RepID=A0AAD7HJS2_9AGAR|nr:hypothetical protein B0H16DRAFT_1473629 [Mycena metata]